MNMVRTATRIISALALAALAWPAAAQDYPTKAITLIVPFAAGGPTDAVARMIAQSMTTTLKQTVLVDNAGGAGGTIGATKAARANPDGYTIFLHHIGHATAPTLYRKLPYDAIKDFEPIGLVTDVPMTVVSKKDWAPKDMKELIAYVKANKDKVTYGNAGIGSASHLCGMLLMSAIGAEVTTIPYKGTAPAMNDLLGGQIDFMCDQTTNTTGQIKGGKIKAYAVTTATRVPSLPNVPTAQESGLPGFDLAVWHGLYAPKGTPKPVIDKLVAALQVAVKDPQIKTRLEELGSEPVTVAQATPDALRKQLASQIDLWAPIIKKAGAYAD
jgi:tripartite-type tricarboxylate transporter receptor subunit TctC